MKKQLMALLAVIAVLASLALPAAATSDDSEATPELSAEGRYVVLLEEEPLAIQFDRDQLDSPAAQAKGRKMKADQTKAARGAGVKNNDVTYNYVTALNGFAAELSDAQVAKLKSTKGVMAVVPDVIRYAQTDSSPDFLGLTKGNGAWNQGVDGEGVIVGVIDSGIWPEHPSFADDGSYSDIGIELDESDYPACDFGNTAHNAKDVAFECNNKLLGARQVLPTYRANIPTLPDEFDSARDDDGHGTHTASTAAGNAGVEATALGHDLGPISGIAPRARIIAYKGLGNLGGFGSDLAAAIDQAVADGVDVINYSIGSSSPAIGPDDLAFLFAADAGVSVATSAGNSGPGPSTVGSPATVPWLTSVGASTQPRFFGGTATLGNGASYLGASLTGSVGESPLVDAEFAGIGGQNAELCTLGSLDPAIVSGKIVLCKRGAIARVEKSEAVLEAGGVGMIHYNASDVDNLVTDPYFVPSVHIDYTPGLEIKDYIASTENPTARIDTLSITTWPSAPSMAIFSSRGPDALNENIIKPDVTAPGVQVLAGWSPEVVSGLDGELFTAINGTSMSSPHVAGLMALLTQVHPDWSPAMVRSALMTTAYQDVVDNDRVSPATPFDMGSGHVNLGSPKKQGSAFQPGLVFDAGWNDYLGFLCDGSGLVGSTTCSNLEAAGIATTASNLNYPSLARAELAGSEVFTRTVTSVTEEKGFRTFKASVDAPEGFEVEVIPDTLKLRSGQSATYQIRITNVSAPVGEWRHGSMSWDSGAYHVYSPISVKGTSYAGPAEINGSGVDGTAGFPMTFGYTGAYTAAAHGLEPAAVTTGNVLQDEDQDFSPADVATGGAVLVPVEVSGAALLRIAMPPDAAEADADIDIFVIGPGGNLVASSTNGGTDELIDLVLPVDGTYSVYVHGWAAPGGDSDFTLYNWVVSATPGGNMSVTSAPTSVTAGETADINVAWTGATAGEWHLGAVSHSNADGLMGLTVVNVDNR